ncbi:hypothetical protein N7478_012330 [Penicillium angulare]|uniref:uncharacterized protein n=1 Tax=Penicillium angulare TaxID=116970 RepID=UPI002540A7B5|nr:uncharacterized protein N7478_012330 [Penicillium angulare]KAJ5259349.1 hypothetical protein N7478_012330 [Penicillium angulare]
MPAANPNTSHSAKKPMGPGDKRIVLGLENLSVIPLQLSSIAKKDIHEAECCERGIRFSQSVKGKERGDYQISD